MAYFFIDFEGLIIHLDLERSQKVDLGRCRFQGPIRSLRLEDRRKTHPTYPNRGVNENLLMKKFCEWINSQLIKVNQCTVVGHGDVPGSKSNNETRTVNDALSHCTL